MTSDFDREVSHKPKCGWLLHQGAQPNKALELPEVKKMRKPNYAATATQLER
jgi:hypothetical protein